MVHEWAWTDHPKHMQIAKVGLLNRVETDDY